MPRTARSTSTSGLDGLLVLAIPAALLGCSETSDIDSAARGSGADDPGAVPSTTLGPAS